MGYTELSEQFLNSLYALGRQKRTKEIGNNMKGETFALLYLALAQTPVTPGELVNAMEISSARVAALLNALEKKEMISREIAASDRRKILVKLTEKGYAKAQECQRCTQKIVYFMMEHLGEADAEHLIRIVNKITDMMAEMQETIEVKEEEKIVIED